MASSISFSPLLKIVSNVLNFWKVNISIVTVDITSEEKLKADGL